MCYLQELSYKLIRLQNVTTTTYNVATGATNKSENIEGPVVGPFCGGRFEQRLIFSGAACGLLVEIISTGPVGRPNDALSADRPDEPIRVGKDFCR
jgi:hypothetical protein